MTIHKHELPILEFDTEKEAVLMPRKKVDFPEKCVYAFLGDTIEKFAFENKAIKIGVFDTITKEYTIYKTIYKGEEICFCQAPLGASASTQLLDFLIASGVKYVIACGSCGVLTHFEENEVIIPTSALRDEGTSYHYQEPAREILLDLNAIQSIKRALTNAQLPYSECKTWTTDGFFRETKDMITYRKQEGCEVVEMECSALAACSQFRKIVFGQILFTADSLAYLDRHETREWGEKSYDKAFELSFESVYLIDKP